MGKIYKTALTAGKNTRGKKSGYVYIIRCHTAYKIGVSIDPETRYKTFSTPFPIEEIYTRNVEDMFSIEHYLHHLFKEKHSNGEWFILSEEDLQHAIEHIKKQIPARKVKKEAAPLLKQRMFFRYRTGL